MRNSEQHIWTVIFLSSEKNAAKQHYFNAAITITIWCAYWLLPSPPTLTGLVTYSSVVEIQKTGLTPLRHWHKMKRWTLGFFVHDQFIKYERDFFCVKFHFSIRPIYFREHFKKANLHLMRSNYEFLFGMICYLRHSNFS